jgi:hypothetical protein
VIWNTIPRHLERSDVIPEEQTPAFGLRGFIDVRCSMALLWR